MKIYFSNLSQGFYHEGIQKNIPTDVVEIDKNTYDSIYLKLSSGYKANIQADGKVEYEINTSFSNTEDGERLWRNSELYRADIELNKVQDSDSKAVGSVSDWRLYRKMLRVWPEHSEFPKKEFRPRSPDFKE